MNLQVWKRTFRSWKVYVYVIVYTAMLLAFYSSRYFNLWLKEKGTYTVTQINNYPTGTSAVSVVASLIGCALAFVYIPWYIFMSWVFGMLIYTIIMTIYNVPKGFAFFAFYMTGFGSSGTAILFLLINKILSKDQESIALV